MSDTWELKRTKQCEKCPWKVGVDPHTIPNGYSEELHENLRDTIATDTSINNEVKVMACHLSKKDHEMHCIGWLVNQIGVGNNIPMRISLLTCTNADQIEVYGEQHPTFEDTLPS